ncbi:hypothetical protein [Xanthomonas oryzae]|uniref:hypothetical protein n=1 Tax=Xanthomonas oryzae TaxID=347 RepID=UPI0010C5B0FA|nr:hypothetical protein [Xanthomonas oryzae]QBN68203.1 hypothetical protein EBA12_08760 [Xanthomonas oryzae pv. oryzae]
MEMRIKRYSKCLNVFGSLDEQSFGDHSMSAFVDVLVMDFEQYAAQHGASMAGIGDTGTHKRGRNQSDKQWRRLLASSDRRSREILARRKNLEPNTNGVLLLGKSVSQHA